MTNAHKSLLALCCGLTSLMTMPTAHAQACTKTIYLTFDTGSQSQAQFIAGVLKKHAVKATFFLANEPTVNGDHSLGPAWAAFWKNLVADGHAFGTHTFDHVYLDRFASTITVKPQFGTLAARTLRWNDVQYCQELKRSDAQFQTLTGRPLDALWRAPGGRVNAATLAAARRCGYQHIGWSEAGFLGDELPSDRYPNANLLVKALNSLKDGDIAMAHLGIWSRQDPWAPAVLEPLIVGLKQQGACFATLTTHPSYRHDGQGAALFTKAFRVSER